MIVEDLCRIPEDEWAKYAFSREPLNGKFNDEPAGACYKMPESAVLDAVIDRKLNEQRPNRRNYSKEYREKSGKSLKHLKLIEKRVKSFSFHQTSVL